MKSGALSISSPDLQLISSFWKSFRSFSRSSRDSWSSLGGTPLSGFGSGQLPAVHRRAIESDDELLAAVERDQRSIHGVAGPPERCRLQFLANPRAGLARANRLAHLLTDGVLFDGSLVLKGLERLFMGRARALIQFSQAAHGASALLNCGKSRTSESSAADLSFASSVNPKTSLPPPRKTFAAPAISVIRLFQRFRQASCGSPLRSSPSRPPEWRARLSPGSSAEPPRMWRWRSTNPPGTFSERTRR